MGLLPENLNTHQSNKKVLIRGYYGYRNIGDEAMLYVLVKSLKAKGFEPVIATKDLEYTKRLHNSDVIYSSIHNIIQLANQFLKVKILIEGPGNKHGFLSIIDFGLPIIAKILGKKVMYIGVGINPNKWTDLPTINIPKNVKYKNPLKKAIITLVFNHLVDFISVRDELSKEVLVSNGVKEKKIQLTKDLAFYLETMKKEDIWNILSQVSSPQIQYKKGAIIVTISIRRFRDGSVNENFEKFLERVIFQILSACNSQKTYFLFLPFSFGSFDNDIKYAERIMPRLKRKYPYANFHIVHTDNPIHIKSIIAMSHFVIGVRYHSHVFAESLGVPYVAVIYDPKSLQVVKNSKTCIGYAEITSLNTKGDALIAAVRNWIGGVCGK